MHICQFVVHALAEVITSPTHEESVIRKYFSPNYHQVVNGQHLDFNHFLHHMALLKQEAQHIALTLIAAASEGDTVLTHHQVSAEKVDGTTVSFDVMAHFTVTGGQIIRCEELTRMLKGAESDQDLSCRH
ncbi:nuclear transport factor 2 family protein [Vibrio gazogenes]|uniref:SnoaL-like domain-containing protein n=1 Tax=Vibrio gazogenes TaxID=687 RepID=A0A1Z2SLA0_VIBGA|nr:nuclear transport factor 2 family protein [Vibrio gazogenes]ASA57954.1 hypothetical protein BSQ33_19805 [Vibrio gazogenes]